MALSVTAFNISAADGTALVNHKKAASHGDLTGSQLKQGMQVLFLGGKGGQWSGTIQAVTDNPGVAEIAHYVVYCIKEGTKSVRDNTDQLTLTVTNPNPASCDFTTSYGPTNGDVIQ
jgi:hypothetical protein